MNNVDKYTITHRGVPVSRLNKGLVRTQGLSDETVKQIITLHQQKLQIYDNIKGEENVNSLKDMAFLIEEVEYALQFLWGFSHNKNFHRFWETPKCSCPKYDNEDRYPYGPYRINTQCLLHSL